MSDLSGIKEERLNALKKNYEKPELLNFSYLFCWDDVPGNNAELLKFLKDGLKTEWVGEAEIKKGNDNETVTVAKGTNSVVLKLNKDEGYVTLETNESEKFDFLVKEEDGKLNIYSASFDRAADSERSDLASGCGPGILM
jgi:hypothetical protein